MNGRARCVVDTTVLQKANAPLVEQPRARALFRKRVELLRRINDGTIIVMISAKLLAEYRRQVREPRNDFIQAFFAILDQADAGSNPTVLTNWKKRWSGADREKARKCNFPKEDDHVLRTAIMRDRDTTIFTEEHGMLMADACIHQHFRVHILNPCE